MQKFESVINEAWEKRDIIASDPILQAEIKQILDLILTKLNDGTIRVAEKIDGQWILNAWIKKAILMYFKFNDSKIYKAGYANQFDKIPPKYHSNLTEEDFKIFDHRIVPGSYVRDGCYIGKNVIIMPAFVNIGAYIGEGTLIDTWATVGSCAQIGKRCHISGGSGIGGVLEPLQSKPVIIEDNCFIGARCEIVEGVIVEEGAVISMGVFIGSSTKIVDRRTGEIIYGKVPAYSVIVPGTLPSADGIGPSLYCAVIIKQVDESTRQKTSINELLRF